MSGHCRRIRCRCTHSHPCDHGWIEAPDHERNGQHYTRAVPCPVCKPELTERLDEAALLRARTR
jgi:hypothetical protein